MFNSDPFAPVKQEWTLPPRRAEREAQLKIEQDLKRFGQSAKRKQAAQPEGTPKVDPPLNPETKPNLSVQPKPMERNERLVDVKQSILSLFSDVSEDQKKLIPIKKVQNRPERKEAMNQSATHTPAVQQHSSMKQIESANPSEKSSTSKERTPWMALRTNKPSAPEVTPAAQLMADSIYASIEAKVKENRSPSKAMKLPAVEIPIIPNPELPSGDKESKPVPRTKDRIVLEPMGTFGHLHRYLQNNPKQRVRPAEPDMKRIVQSLLFFAPDQTKEKEYARLFQSKKVFGLNRFQQLEKSSDVVKEMFSMTLKEITKSLRVNSMAALYLLEIHLTLRWKEYLHPQESDPNKLELNLEGLKLKLKLEGGQISRDSKLLRELSSALEQLYMGEATAVLAIYAKYAKDETIVFSKAELGQAVQNTLLCLKRRQEDKVRRPSQAKMLEIDQARCLQLLSLLLGKDNTLITSAAVLEFVKKPLDESRGILLVPYQRIVNSLLRLDIIAVALNGGPRETEDLKLYINYPMILDALASHRLPIYRAIAPAISICIKPSGKFTSSKQNLSNTIGGGLGLDWLEVWCYNRKFSEEWERTFLIRMLHRVMASQYSTFWKHLPDFRYLSIRKGLALLYSQSYWRQLIDIMTVMLGECEDAFAEMMMRNMDLLLLNSKERTNIAANELIEAAEEYGSQLRVTFSIMLARMIELQPWMINSILDPILNRSSLEFLSQSLRRWESNCRLQTGIFKALNRLLQGAGIRNQQIIRVIQRCPPLDFSLLEDQKISRGEYQQYLQTLTKHTKLLRETANSNASILSWVTNILQFLFELRNLNSSICVLQLLIEDSLKVERDSLTDFIRKHADSKQLDNLPRTLYDIVLDIGILEKDDEVVRCYIDRYFFGTDEKAEARVSEVVSCLNVVQKCLLLHSKEFRSKQSRLVLAIYDQFVMEFDLFPKRAQYQNEGSSCSLGEVLLELTTLDDQKLPGKKNNTGSDLALIACKVFGSLISIQTEGQSLSIYRPERDGVTLQRLLDSSSTALTHGTPYRVHCQLRLLVLLFRSNKLLGRQLVERLLKQLLHTTDQLFNSRGVTHMPSANILLILLVEMFRDPRFCQKCRELVKKEQISSIIECTFSKIMYFGEDNVDNNIMETYRQLLISNVCVLVSTLLGGAKDAENALLDTFFEIYNGSTVQLILGRYPNYHQQVMDRQQGLWLPEQYLDEVNMKSVFLENAPPYSNSLAYSNWCRLYLMIVNEQFSDLKPLKQLVKRSESRIADLMKVLLHLLSRKKITFPDPVYFVVGATVRIQGNNQKLVGMVEQQINWLKDVRGTGKVFAAEAIYSKLGIPPVSTMQLEESITQEDGPAVELLCMLNNRTRRQGMMAYASQVARQSFLTGHAKRFASTCNFLMGRIKDGVAIEGIACKLKVLLYDVDFSSMRCYMDQHRYPAHINWCWLLLLVREMLQRDGTNCQLVIFLKFMLERTHTITTEELMGKDWYTVAHQEQLQFMASAYCGLLASGGSLDFQTALRLLKTIVEGCNRQHHPERSLFEQTLSKEATVQSTGKSFVSTSPKDTYLRIATDLINMDGVWYATIMLSKLLQQNGHETAQHRDIVLMENTLSSAVFWLHDLYDRMGKAALSKSLPDMGIPDEVLTKLHEHCNTAAATIELGYLNTICEHHSRASIQQNISYAINNIAKLMVKHVRTILADPHLSIASNRFATLQKTLSKLYYSPLMSPSNREELKDLLSLRKA